ncbi:MAG: hypothetical protein ACLTW9_07945 [Enterocloster sp.]
MNWSWATAPAVFHCRGYTVLEASFQLRTGDKAAIEASMKELAARRREKAAPSNIPAPAVPSSGPRDILRAQLIEDAGLRG